MTTRRLSGPVRLVVCVVLVGIVCARPARVEGHEQLAYVWHREDRYGLSLVTLGQGEELLIEGTQRLSMPTWCPRGDALVFARDVAGQWQLFRLDLAGRHLQQLTDVTTGADYPRISPDGRWIVFRTYQERAGSNLSVMAATGGTPRILSTAPSEARPGEWIPGTGLYAYLGEVGGNSQVWLADAASGAVRQLTTGQQAKAGIMPSPDGRLIAVHKLFIDVTTGAEHPWYPSAQKVHLPGVVAELATWNPQGTVVAFVSNVDQKSYEVYRMAPDGAEIHNLTRHSAFDSFPAWSPDGLLIAFISNRRGPGRYEVYVMDSDGGHVRRVTHGLEFQFSRPIWRPLAERLAGKP